MACATGVARNRLIQVSYRIRGSAEAAHEGGAPGGQRAYTTIAVLDILLLLSVIRRPAAPSPPVS
jgi:isoprenylcysteine carboxyl methyltransferase (ICMT) family protein YpbQ